MRRWLWLFGLCLMPLVGCGAGDDPGSGGAMHTLVAFISTALTFGGALFWIWLLMVVLFMFPYVGGDNPRAGLATVVFGISFVLFILLGNAEFLTWLKHQGLLGWLKIFGVIVGPGIPWFFIKWHLWTRRCARRFVEVRREWLRQAGIAGSIIPADRESAFVEQCKRLVPRVYPKPPQVNEHKNRIIIWGLYWPFSLLESILKDLLWEMWDLIVDYFKVRLQRIANRNYSNAEKDSSTS